MTVTLLILAGCGFLPFLSDDALNARFDLDNDGVSRPDDCDDNDPNVGIVRQYADVDEDGFGFGVAIEKCGEIAGYAMDDGDCDDQDAAVNPDAQEVCDGIDNDCDSGVDVDPTDGSTYYADSDADTFGDADVFVNTCEQPNGYVPDATDCDDTNSSTNPNATELCDDTIDNDCDGATDEDASYTTQYLDEDEDGYGDVSVSIVDCNAVPGYVTNATDCDDTNADVNPGAEEICNNGLDDNCDDSAGTCLFEGTMSASDTEDVIVGEGTGDNACQTIASLGDLDTDGYDDVVVGAPLQGDGDAGMAYVMHGPIIGTVNLTDSAAMIGGENNGDQIGVSASSAGDFNDDGYNDVALGSPYNDDPYENTGGVYIFLGPISGSLTISDASVTLLGGMQEDAVGTSVAEIGDIDTDGYDDLLVGAPGVDDEGAETGSAYLVFGTSSTETQTLGSTQQLVLWGEEDGDRTGSATASSDLDCDGGRDLLVGAPGSTPSGTTHGTVYVVYGPFIDPGEFSLSDADVAVTGVSDEGETQMVLSGTTDVDDDGCDDLLVGSPGHDGVGADSGAVYLFTAFEASAVTIETAYTTFSSGAGGDRYGGAVVSENLDVDGNIDIIIGAAYDNTYAGDAGATTIFFGPIASGTIGVEGADVTILGEASSDLSGSAIAIIGYGNEDDFPDFATGAPSSGRNTTDAGACFVFSWLEL